MQLIYLYNWRTKGLNEKILFKLYFSYTTMPYKPQINKFNQTELTHLFADKE